MPTTNSGKIPRPPEHMMRYMLHSRAVPYVYYSLGASLFCGMSYAYFYMLPMRNAYREYAKNYDAYEDMRRICAYPKKYMITCPELLYEKMQEKGIVVAENIDPFSGEEISSADKETANANSVESFNA